MDLIHIPVMVKEVCEILKASEGGYFVDCTLGLGGHSSAILRMSEYCSILGIDRDEKAIELAKENLKEFKERVKIIKCNFKDVDLWSKELKEKPKGILIDLGLSSLQLMKGRGFSFNDEESLDMRMDTEDGIKAIDFLEKAKEDEIADVLKKYGEVNQPYKIAKEIKNAIKEKKIYSAKDLANVVSSVFNKKKSNIHPATKIFQAIRIHINKELEGLDLFLKKAVELLKESGKIVVISYHSLEDRIVKNAFRDLKKGCICPPKIPLCVCGKKPLLSFASKTPLRASMDEVLSNNRSRSAKLRYAIRL